MMIFFDNQKKTLSLKKNYEWRRNQNIQIPWLLSTNQGIIY